ncbi:MAG: flagellar biosynthesis anti-sigma factor FlgM [Thiohalomonadales bacterium]
MTIDINGVGKTTIPDLKQGSVPKQLNGGEQQTLREEKTAISVGTSDTVNITRSAASLQAVEQQLSSIPVVDQKRVEQLRLAIENGSYQIDAQRTAEKFLEMEFVLNR